MADSTRSSLSYPLLSTNNSESEYHEPHCDTKFWKGAMFQVIASTCNFLCFASFEYSNFHTGVGNAQMLTVRGYVAVILTGFLLWHEGVDISTAKDHKMALAGRGMFGFLAQSCLCIGLTMLNFSIATTMFNTNPIIGVILGALVFKERVTLMQIVALFVTFLGVILLLMPCVFTGTCEEGDFNAALLLPLLAAVFRGIAVVFVRKCRGVHWALPTFAFGVPFCIIPPLFLWFQGSYMPIPWSIWAVLIVGAACGTTGNIFNAKSLKIAEMGLNTPICYLVVIFSSFTDVLWGVEIHHTQWLGAIVVFCGILCVTYVKYQQGLEKKRLAEALEATKLMA